MVAKNSGASDSAANGKLGLGGICTLLLGAVFLANNFIAKGAMGAGADIGIVVYIILGGLAVLSFLASSGWFAAGSLYGGANSVAGVFWIIFGSGNLLILLAILLGIPILAFIGLIAMGLGLVLGGVLGGIGLLGGQARGSSGAIKPIAGIVLLIGGIASVWVLLQGFGVGLPLGNIMNMVSSYGTAGGLILAGLTMMMSKS